MFLAGSCCDACSLGDAEATSKPSSNNAALGKWLMFGGALAAGYAVFQLDKVRRTAGRARYVRYRMGSGNTRTTADLPAFESMSEVVFGKRR